VLASAGSTRNRTDRNRVGTKQDGTQTVLCGYGCREGNLLHAFCVLRVPSPTAKDFASIWARRKVHGLRDDPRSLGPTVMAVTDALLALPPGRLQ
jgi:hypothetical protein